MPTALAAKRPLFSISEIGFSMALVWLWCGFVIPSIWLVDGFVVALGGFARGVVTTKYAKYTKWRGFGKTGVPAGRGNSVLPVSHSFFVCPVYFVVCPLHFALCLPFPAPFRRPEPPPQRFAGPTDRLSVGATITLGTPVERALALRDVAIVATAYAAGLRTSARVVGISASICRRWENRREWV